MKIGMLLKCWLSETFFKVLCKMKEFFFYTMGSKYGALNF